MRGEAAAVDASEWADSYRGQYSEGIVAVPYGAGDT